jgi:hypothetical protein
MNLVEVKSRDTGYCEQYQEPAGFIKDKFLDRLRDY